jgi:hypothetical protein
MSARLLIPLCALAAALAAAGCSSEPAGSEPAAPATTAEQALAAAGTAAGDAAGGDGADADVSAVDPCSLLTTEEIVAQLEAAEDPAAPIDGGYEITTEAASVGANRSCVFSWRSEASSGGQPLASGQFNLDVLPAADVDIPTAFAGETTPIDGVGDRAFVALDVPYAVVGSHLIGVFNFHGSREGAIELLRAAAQRLGG